MSTSITRESTAAALREGTSPEVVPPYFVTDGKLFPGLKVTIPTTAQIHDAQADARPNHGKTIRHLAAHRDHLAMRLQDVLSWIESSGIEKFPAFAGANIEPLIKAREALARVPKS